MVQTTKKVAAIMTAARYENTYCRNYIEIALKELGIPLTVSGGVFYMGNACRRCYPIYAATIAIMR